MTQDAERVRLVVEAFERYGQENPGQTWDCFGPEFAARLAVEALIDRTDVTEQKTQQAAAEP